MSPSTSLASPASSRLRSGRVLPALVLLAAGVLAGGAVACGAPIRQVAYTPNPARVTNPTDEVRTVILANTVSGCVSEPELMGQMLVVKFVCTGAYHGGVGNRVVRFDKIAQIRLEESGGWYRVLVKHSDGTADFDWTSKSLDDMRRLADALTALSTHGAHGAPGAPVAHPAGGRGTDV